jgi:hypothetical protein
MIRTLMLLTRGMAVVGMLHASCSAASQLTLSECVEGSDFIGNAALARDAGMTEEKFIERMQQDFTLIHAYRQEMRWFAHDSDDEAFLLGAAREVFVRPDAPEEHRRAFLQACFVRMK